MEEYFTKLITSNNDITVNVNVTINCKCCKEPEPIPQEKARTLYVWNGDMTRRYDWYSLLQNVNNLHDTLINFCIEHGFTKVIIFNGTIEWDYAIYNSGVINYETNCKDLFTKLNNKGIKVALGWYLNDSVNNLNNWEKATSILDAVKNFNIKYPEARIQSIHGDQEPYKPELYEDYLNMNSLLKNHSKEINSGIKIGASIKPGWFSDYKGKLMIDHVVETLDFGMIMAYSYIISDMKEYGNQALARGIPMEIAVEVDPRQDLIDQNISFGQFIKNNPQAFKDLLDECDQEWSTKSNYLGMVVHSFSHYFGLLNGHQPVDN